MGVVEVVLDLNNPPPPSPSQHSKKRLENFLPLVWWSGNTSYSTYTYLVGKYTYLVMNYTHIIVDLSQDSVKWI